LIDDILDFTGTSASLGKASLSDIHQVIQLFPQYFLNSILPFQISITYGIIYALYGQGIVTAPILFAIEEFPELHEIVEKGFDDPSNVEMVRIISVLSFVPSAMLSNIWVVKCS
jgi:geranyl diphosphate synthase